MAVSDALSQHFLDVDIETDVANGRLLAYLAKNGEILSRTYSGDRVSIHCRMPRKFLGQIRPDEAHISLRGVGHDLPRNGNGFVGSLSTNGTAESHSKSFDDVA
jgi:GTP-binding protein HflX